MTNRNKYRSWRLARNEEPPRKYVVSIRSGKNGIVCNSMAVFAVTVCSVFTKGCLEVFWGCGFLWYWLWGVDDYWNESGWQVLHRGFLSYGRGTEYFDGLPCPMGCTACWLGEEDSPNDRRWKKTLPTIRTVKKEDASHRSSPEGEDVDSFGNSFCPLPFWGVWKIRVEKLSSC